MAKADGKPGLTVEKIQEKINEKLSAKRTSFFADKIQNKVGAVHDKLELLNGKVHEKLRERVCCKMCGALIFVGILAVSSLLVGLIVGRLQPKHYQSTCGIRCVVRSASWTNFTEAQISSLVGSHPSAVLDTLSAAWVEHHAAEFAEGHRAVHSVSRLQDAHDRMAHELISLDKEWKAVGAMEDSAAKMERVRNIITKSEAVQAMASEVENGKSFNEVRVSRMTESDAFEARSCADILRTVAIEPCKEDVGTTTGFLRALGVGAAAEQQNKSSTMWPVNSRYPGLSTLNDKNGIHIVDGFLSNNECAALLKGSITKHMQNRTSISHNSFAQLHSSSDQKVRSHEHRVPKWMYAGMPGALIELDIKAAKAETHCKPVSTDMSSDEMKSPGAWKETMSPLFQERGGDLEKCKRIGFGDTSFYDVACPSDAQIMQQVESKIAVLTQASSAQLQPLKLLHYGRGDFDLDHFDTDDKNSNGKVAPLMTVVVFLSSAKGGATYFPNLDLRVDAVKGRALIFPTMNMDLNPVAASLHAEEEVKQGDKWVLGTSVFLGQREAAPNPCA